MAMKPTDWASVARNGKYQQSPEHQRAIDIMESVLLAKETPSDAANAIATTYEAHLRETIVIGGFWAIFSDAARACGGVDDQADRLTDLIIAIQGLSDVTDSYGRLVTHEYGGVFWRDLPDWRITFREYGIYVEGPDDFEQPESVWRKQRAPLLNATTFAAILLARAPFPTGMEHHACTAFSCALNAKEGDNEQHLQAETYLPAAATWILRAGQKLREACRIRLDARHVYTLSPERWNEWKHRFEAISIDPKFDQENREWAARAAGQMETVEVE